jgi:hypothetical protein
MRLKLGRPLLLTAQPAADRKPHTAEEALSIRDQLASTVRGKFGAAKTEESCFAALKLAARQVENKQR